MEHVEVLQAKSRPIVDRIVSQIDPITKDFERELHIRDLLHQVPQEDRTPLRLLAECFLLHMHDVDASDIEVGGYGTKGHVWMRVNGEKIRIEKLGKYSQDEFSILIQNILSDHLQNNLLQKGSVDFSYTVTHFQNSSRYRFRATSYMDLNRVALNMRAIGNKVWPYESYQFHPNVTRLFSLSSTKEGLNLITGITGSGKSTTMDAIINHNNCTVNGHIAIIASPIEFVHESNKCIVRMREVGSDTSSFKDGAIEALRQDPDIIVIGEMRDPETIGVSLEAADSGHKVFSTLHTSSAVESIDRIIGEIPPIEQNRIRNRLADSLRCVVSQKLVPTLNGKRALAMEVLVNTPSVRSAIKNENISEIYQMITESGKFGMKTMEQSLRQLVRRREISPETAMNFANNKRRMRQLL